MKNTLYIIGIAAGMLLSNGAAAQKQTYKGKITVNPKELQQLGDSLYVNLDFLLRGVNVKSRQSADFTPILTSATQNRKLPKVSVKGRNNYKAYKRTTGLMSKRQKADYVAPYKVVKGYKKAVQNQTIAYHYVLPYEPWMADARLDLQNNDCGCAGSTMQTEMQRLVNNISLEKIIIEPYQITPYLTYVQPEAEQVNRRELVNESFLDFAVGKTVILPEFGNNPQELAKIRSMIEGVKNDKGVTIQNVAITGYASPEGSLAINKRLSEGRAKALQSYLQSRYDIPQGIYKVYFGGEDWDGLLKAITASDMAYKNEVIEIIERVEIVNGRETKLMALKGGAPYKQMLKEMFPSLRKVVCKVDYIKSFDLSQAKELIKTKPQHLSLDEMYQVANSYEKGSQEFNDVFETAVKMFPQDQTANINAAAVALARKDVVSAERYLNNIKTKSRIPEMENSLGVLYLLKGDYDKAEQYLKSAEQAGVAAAKSNLEELAKKRENIERINSIKK